MTAEGEASSDQRATSSAFEEFRRAAGATTAEDQDRVDTAQRLADHLMHVTPEELVVLHQIGIASIDTEMARRSLEATNASALAIGRLHQGLADLKVATDRWSRRLTALTIAAGAFTLVLLGLTFTLIGLVIVQLVIAIVLAHR